MGSQGREIGGDSEERKREDVLVSGVCFVGMPEVRKWMIGWEYEIVCLLFLSFLYFLNYQEWLRF